MGAFMAFLSAARCMRATKPPLGVCPPALVACVDWMRAAAVGVVGVDFDMLISFCCKVILTSHSRPLESSPKLGTSNPYSAIEQSPQTIEPIEAGPIFADRARLNNGLRE